MSRPAMYLTVLLICELAICDAKKQDVFLWADIKQLKLS